MWYLLKRGLQMLFILVVLSAALFGLLSAMPGNPVDLLITSNPKVKPEDIIRLKKLRGLDKPWYVQYVRWLWGYKEPVRPPKIESIDPIELTHAKKTIRLDVAPYIKDENFIPSEDVFKRLLKKHWPNYEASPVDDELKLAMKNNDLSSVLRLVANKSVSMQNRLVKDIAKESTKELEVVGLFGAKAHDTIIKKRVTPNDSYVWFKVINSYGQESVGQVLINHNKKKEPLLIRPIDTKVVENEKKPFTLDLTTYLLTASKEDISFSLVGKSKGKIKNGIYTHLFVEHGQSVIKIKAQTKKGVEQKFAFAVEHGVIGHESKFNRGFLFFLTGDRASLGFSQTYKRPVYDLLFGAPSICGDGEVDVGERCDDGNKINNDACTNECFFKNDTFLDKAETHLSAAIYNSGRIGNTIQLMLPAILLSLLIAIPLGLFSAYRQYSILDYIVNFCAFIGISLPVFWFGIMMIYLFAENMQILPAGGVQTPGIYNEGVIQIALDRLRHALLPTMVLSIFYVGRWLRYMRASMLEVLPKDYIRTARAKGLSERVVVLKHAFRNALIPVVTVLALSIPSLFGGAVLTETVFSWPGVGRLQYDAVMNSDYYVAIVVFLVSAILVMLGNLLADALYVLVDPRIRKSR